MRYHERIVMLSVLDGLWKDHLLAMDHLKEGIGLRGYAQQDPLVAYKKESFEMFEAMMIRFQEDTLRHLFRMQIIGPDGAPIETAEQLQQLQSQQALPPQSQQQPNRLPQHTPIPDPAADPATQPGTHPTMPVTSPTQPSAPDALPPLQRQPAPASPRRSSAPSTTIDALEREFERKKQRELQQAQSAGGASTNGNGPHLVGAKVGRNDPCPCGSGKKYKKCHGAEV